MARFTEPTTDQEQEWKAWLRDRPSKVRAVAERFDPWGLYRMKSTGHRVTVYSFGEEKNGNVSLTVNVLGEFNALAFERRVFGIHPDDLEPCDLPEAHEVTGALLSSTDVENNIDVIRVMTRPDLWEMGEDGKAIRKH